MILFTEKAVQYHIGVYLSIASVAIYLIKVSAMDQFTKVLHILVVGLQLWSAAIGKNKCSFFFFFGKLFHLVFFSARVLMVVRKFQVVPVGGRYVAKIQQMRVLYWQQMLPEKNVASRNRQEKSIIHLTTSQVLNRPKRSSNGDMYNSINVSWLVKVGLAVQKHCLKLKIQIQFFSAQNTFYLFVGKLKSTDKISNALTEVVDCSGYIIKVLSTEHAFKRLKKIAFYVI